MLSDPWPGLEEFFTPGSEILLTSSADETLAAMDLDDHEIARIARAGRERVLDEHTSEQRARELEHLLGATAPRELAEA
jgi:spore maturation protein CgeB